jgi:4-diphosphocytidyl-2-C-methyl-D-erythritol kinase
MKIRSFAKVNLGLEVLGKRPDGYHDILTLFQCINMSDVLEFVPAPGRDIRLSGNDPSVPWDERNLIHRAAELLRRETGKGSGVLIEVAKSIPAGRGLGGGSGNAAMTLFGLNILWDLNLSPSDLAGLGKRLGADVPYFLEGGLCLGEERGDQVTPLPDLPPVFYLLAFPPFPVGTAGIYAAWRPSLTSAAKPSKIKRFLENKDFGLLENQLEETIFRSYPQLEEFKRFFQGQGAEASLVSGTGSTVFGLFAEKEKALRGWRELRKRVPALVVKSLPRETYWRRLRAGVSPSW